MYMYIWNHWEYGTDTTLPLFTISIEYMGILCMNIFVCMYVDADLYINIYFIICIHVQIFDIETSGWIYYYLMALRQFRMQVLRYSLFWFLSCLLLTPLHLPTTTLQFLVWIINNIVVLSSFFSVPFSSFFLFASLFPYK